jgi:hypothetical protein
VIRENVMGMSEGVRKEKTRFVWKIHLGWVSSRNDGNHDAD